jgi:hypothetical protein
VSPAVKLYTAKGTAFQCLRDNSTCQIAVERKAIETGCDPAAERRHLG